MAKRPRPDGAFRDDFGPGPGPGPLMGPGSGLGPGPGPGPGFGFDDTLGGGLGMPGPGLGGFGMDLDLSIGLGGLDFGAFPLVKLRGLPFAASEGDIITFLAIDPIDIVMVRRNGRFSGEAFVLLSHGQVELALAKNRTYLGRRYVEVFPAKKQDYYRAVVALVSEGDFGSPGLGPGLMGFGPDLGGMGMASNGHFNMGPLGGRGIGNGGGPQGGHGRGRGRFGGRGGPPSDRSRPPPPDLAIKVGDELEGGADRDGHSPTGILKMRGLPFSAVVEDIVHWFNTGDLSIQPIAPDCVHLVMSYDNRPTGTAFVEFLSPMDATTALAKDHQMLGNRYIELFRSSRDEVARSTGAF